MDPGLFSEFAGLWTPLCAADALDPQQPSAFVVAGERIVVFRDAAGVASALIDRCPHRGVALSLGRIEAGEIACPFHGWRFDGAGRCRHVPWNPEAKLDQLAATSLPLREAGGILWLFTGRAAVGEPVLPEVLMHPGTRLTAIDFVWDVHWTRVMENMLDTPHLPFVHGKTIGKGLRGRTGEAMTMEWHETAAGAEITACRAGEPPRTSLYYHFPNIMELAIDPGGRLMRLLAVCNPAEPGKTRLTLFTVRNFAKWRLFDPLFARANVRIAREDQRILESSLPSEVPPPGVERSVATDAPTLAFRKIWFNRIRPS